MSQQSIQIKETQDAISVHARLRGYVRKAEQGVYVSYCPALELYSQGDTSHKAREALIEATQLLIEGCLEDGTLEVVLRECGFYPASEKKPVRKGKANKAKAVNDFGGRPITIPAEIPFFATA